MPSATPLSRAETANASIVAMQKDEAEQVSALFTGVLAELPYYNEQAKRSELAKYAPAGLRTLIADDADAVLLAKLEDRLAGFCFNRQDEGLIWMSWIGIHPDHRRAGLASKLLGVLAIKAKRVGAHKIWCDCRTTNEASRRALAQNGYEQICSISNHWHGQDYILWQRFVG